MRNTCRSCFLFLISVYRNKCNSLGGIGCIVLYNASVCRILPNRRHFDLWHFACQGTDSSAFLFHYRVLQPSVTRWSSSCNTFVWPYLWLALFENKNENQAYEGLGYIVKQSPPRGGLYLYSIPYSSRISLYPFLITS